MYEALSLAIGSVVYMAKPNALVSQLYREGTGRDEISPSVLHALQGGPLRRAGKLCFEGGTGRVQCPAHTFHGPRDE